jgi:23S rRNA (cytosine1962-C5)-methyltransferase
VAKLQAGKFFLFYAIVKILSMFQPVILSTKSNRDYELLDSGKGEKLERYGKIILSRPDPQALWHKHLPESEWRKAHGHFSRSKTNATWKLSAEVPKRWKIELAGLNFWIKPTAFKHTGIFPEQVPNWEWLKTTIASASRKEVSIINLFGYTGGATLACSKAGAAVCHVDGSKTAIAWARENAEISNLQDKSIRWIFDDARKFLTREVKRGKNYDGIIMDPPAFGRGKEGEVWKIEDDLLPLLGLCRKVLSPNPLFVLINGYSSGYSPLAYANNLEEMMTDYKGTIEMGELTIEESASHSLLPAGIFARWRTATV